MAHTVACRTGCPADDDDDDDDDDIMFAIIIYVINIYIYIYNIPHDMTCCVISCHVFSWGRRICRQGICCESHTRLVAPDGDMEALPALFSDSGPLQKIPSGNLT